MKSDNEDLISREHLQYLLRPPGAAAHALGLTGKNVSIQIKLDSELGLF